MDGLSQKVLNAKKGDKFYYAGYIWKVSRKIGNSIYIKADILSIQLEAGTMGRTILRRTRIPSYWSKGRVFRVFPDGKPKFTVTYKKYVVDDMIRTYDTAGHGCNILMDESKLNDTIESTLLTIKNNHITDLLLMDSGNTLLFKIGAKKFSLGDVLVNRKDYIRANSIFVYVKDNMHTHIIM